MYKSKIKNGSVIFFLFYVTIIQAFTGEKYYNIIELINKSDVIARGKVVSINSYEKERGRIYSDILFSVTEIYKGNVVNIEIHLTTLGGTLGGITTFSPDLPCFVKDQESILFLKQNSTNKNKYFILGLPQGKFNLYSSSNNKLMIVRDRFMNQELQISSVNKEICISSEKPMSFDEFVIYIKAYIKK